VNLGACAQIHPFLTVLTRPKPGAGRGGVDFSQTLRTSCFNLVVERESSPGYAILNKIPLSCDKEGKYDATRPDRTYP
jgi:hypothetical protein